MKKKKENSQTYQKLDAFFMSGALFTITTMNSRDDIIKVNEDNKTHSRL